MQDITISQKQIFELAKQVLGEEGWEVTELDSKFVAAEGVRKLKEGTANLNDIYGMVIRAVVCGEYGHPWKRGEDDSKLLGLKEWAEKDVMDLIREEASKPGHDH